MMYNWQLEGWPKFEYDLRLHEEADRRFYALAGQNSGIVQLLVQEEKTASILNLLVKEAMKTSAIEGEFINREDVMSSIKINLGYNTNTQSVKDKRSIGIAQAIINSREHFKEELTEEMLFDWHRSLMLGSDRIHAGVWRSHTEPMQIISGAIGKEKVHFEAPPSNLVPEEMRRFIHWFNQTQPQGEQALPNALVRAALTHLYFESIHPFEDGNGRVGRILAEKALSQQLQMPVLLSLSTTIATDKTSYYEGLKKAQRSLAVNDWIRYFGQVVIESQKDFSKTVAFTVKKTRLLDKIRPIVDAKQHKVIYKMLQEPEFEGGMNARKYQSITKTSKATATRDLADLVHKNILIQSGGGRSTSYQVNLDVS